MAETTSEIREAIEQTRSDVAETIAALGQKADVRNRIAETAREKSVQAKEQLADYAAQAKSKASELRDQAAGHVPDGVAPSLGNAVEQAKEAAAAATHGPRRRWVLGVAAMLIIAGLVVGMLRRGRT